MVVGDLSMGGQSVCLESYLEHKVGDFVKGMRNGSGRNLHPMLIAAVERPLILLTLRETKGNQIQAAELLVVETLDQFNLIGFSAVLKKFDGILLGKF